MKTIQTFKELSSDKKIQAGGKGGTLARLYQAGYPVPDGIIILPDAFVDNQLKAEAWDAIRQHLERMRNGGSSAGFAVRSSALNEDSAQASFGGQFETVLDVSTDEAMQEAILAVYLSRLNERVRSYSEAKQLDQVHEIAIVVQQMVHAEISGVLFTVDPVSGSYMTMTGNFVHGLGDKLVSGEVEPYTFVFERPKGDYRGPIELKRYARKLYKLAWRLEKELGCPQDIEWAVANGQIYILQSRPITTLQSFDPITGEWNDTFKGDFVWSRNNMGEGRPDIMPPFTFSMSDKIWPEISIVPGYSYAGNICGRYYANISFAISMLRVMGKSQEAAIEQMRGMLGHIPEDIDIPLIPLTRAEMIKAFPRILRVSIMESKGKKKVPAFLENNPEWCRTMRKQIGQMDAPSLTAFWNDEIFPSQLEFLGILAGATQPFEQSQKLHDKLVKLVGEADTNTLLSGYGNKGALLASLGPVYGIAKVAQGEMSREEYMEKYGHRGPHEAEPSYPYPYEDPEWLDRQIEDYNRHPVDVDKMLADRQAEFEAARQRFSEQFPARSKRMRRRIDLVGAASHLRENARSEVTRFFTVVRAWALRVGEITGLDNDIFYFTIDEVLDILSGDRSSIRYLDSRKKTYARYRELPTYPMVVRGRFAPFAWASDPERRYDVYDATTPRPITESGTLVGFAGAAGRVEGTVRVLHSPEEGHLLQPGEILVAITTNVGWTPIFPRAGAVVTDVGAPLSHAAIVARELGIPAVVGCGSATTQLKTGDRVRVDGGAGVVEVL